MSVRNFKSNALSHATRKSQIDDFFEWKPTLNLIHDGAYINSSESQYQITPSIANHKAAIQYHNGCFQMRARAKVGLIWES